LHTSQQCRNRFRERERERESRESREVGAGKKKKKEVGGWRERERERESERERERDVSSFVDFIDKLTVNFSNDVVSFSFGQQRTMFIQNPFIITDITGFSKEVTISRCNWLISKQMCP